MKNEIIIIAAIGNNNELGKKGDLIWRIPGDLARFKKITNGHPVIMGYKTFESMNKKPLLGRTNIVMAQDESIEENVKIARTQEAAIDIAKTSEGSDKIFIIGGGIIYKLFLPIADCLNLTIVNEDDADADTFFPQFDKSDFYEVSREENNIDGFKFAFVQFDRRT